MAEGRMLKRNISESRRLAELKTDSARLLWTWIIPFLDSEGRFYASPEMIKGKIVPRLPGFTLKNIPTYINDMARVGLIILYSSDGEKLLQFRKFDTFQKIKKDREAAPLPAPTDQDLVRSKSGVGQDEIEIESRPPVSNLREVNLKKEKDDRFDEFWKIYPNRVKKKNALAEWKRKTIPKNVCEILSRQITHKSRLRDTGKFSPEWPDPERWIKHERWNDEIEIISGGNGTSPYVDCPGCHREIDKNNLTDDGKNCIHCAPRKPLDEIMKGIQDHVGKT